jgi:hypothetical protein
MKVSIDLEDAQALTQNLAEHLQYDSEDDYAFWLAIFERLKTAIQEVEQ